MVPRQLVMRMSSGSSKPYEQAPAVGMHRQASCPLRLQRWSGVGGGGLACTHALLALLELGEELEIAWNLGSHGSFLCGKTQKVCDERSWRGLTVR